MRTKRIFRCTARLGDYSGRESCKLEERLYGCRPPDAEANDALGASRAASVVRIGFEIGTLNGTRGTRVEARNESGELRRLSQSS